MTDETEDESDAEVTLAEAVEFARGMAADEVADFEGEVPKHAPGLIASRGTDLVQTVTNIEMARASERVESPDDEQVQNAVTEDAVDILLALGALAYEYDIDIVEAFEDRMSLVEDYRAFEEAMEDVETRDEAIEAVDEHMTEELSAAMGQGMSGGALSGATPIEPGDNVDDEDYEHEETDKSFA
jgi:hypothetical protein